MKLIKMAWDTYSPFEKKLFKAAMAISLGGNVALWFHALTH